MQRWIRDAFSRSPGACAWEGSGRLWGAVAFWTTLSTLRLLQGDDSQFCVFIHDFWRAGHGGGGAPPGSTWQSREGGKKEASSLHQFPALRGLETSFFFFFNLWSDVTKSDFPDFEFVIIIIETQRKFTFVLLVRSAHEMSPVDI